MKYMQACRAYYNNGRFVPIGLGILPEGTQAIVTLLDESPFVVSEHLKEYDALVDEIHASADEEMPELESITFREVVQ
jgi:tetrahydromethanopterin S-methyltransferase subunit B